MTTENKAPEPVKVQTPAEILAAITVAGAAGDITEVVRLGNLLKKHQGDIAKAEADKLKAEAEAMAGDREKLAVEVWKYVKSMPGITDKLETVKAQGFTFKLDTGEIQYKSVALTVPTIKTRAAGGGGGGTGVSVASLTGLPRAQLIDQYATADEKVTIDKAKTEAAARGGNPNSSGWSAEKPVVKRILADNPSLIKK